MAALLLACTGSIRAANWDYRVLEVKPNVFVWKPQNILEMNGEPAFNRATNSGFVMTSGGVLVVDTSNTPSHARSILYEIRQRTSEPVVDVVNTDSSPARTLGNETFADLEPSIIATSAAAALIRKYDAAYPTRLDQDPLLAVRMRGFHPTSPNKTFDHEMDLTLGGEQIRVIELGDCTSPGDAAVFLPRAKVVFLGGAFENGYFPHIGPGNIRRWIATLKKVETWGADVFIPGNGAPGSREDVENFRRFLKWLESGVEAGIQRKETLGQIENALVPFENYPWRAPELQKRDVEAVYRQLNPAPAHQAAKPQTH